MKINDIAGIVILYNPEADNLKQLNETSKVFDRLFVINNSSQNQNIIDYFSHLDCPKNIELYNNPR
jgi:hypothetical protein